jgi:hypothetical protein
VSFHANLPLDFSLCSPRPVPIERSSVYSQREKKIYNRRQQKETSFSMVHFSSPRHNCLNSFGYFSIRRDFNSFFFRREMNRKEQELASADWLQSGELLARRQLLCERDLRESLARIGDPWLLQEVDEADTSRHAEFGRLIGSLRQQCSSPSSSIQRQAAARLADRKREVTTMMESLTALEQSLSHRQDDLLSQDAAVSRLQQGNGNPQTAAAATRRQPGAVATASDLYQAFLVRHGGMCLGWRDADHNVFLSLVAHGCGQRDISEQFMQRCPHISADELAEHMALHSEFLRLLHDKRVEIEAFRAQRLEDEKSEAATRAAEMQQAVLAGRRDDAVAEQRRLKHALEVKAQLKAMQSAKREEAISKTHPDLPPPSAAEAGKHQKEEAARALRDRTNAEIEAYVAKKAAAAASHERIHRHRIIATTRAEHHASVGSCGASVLERRWADDRRRAEDRLARVVAPRQEAEIAAARLNGAAARLAPRVAPSFDRLANPTASSRARSASNADSRGAPLFQPPAGHKGKVAWCGPAYLR